MRTVGIFVSTLVLLCIVLLQIEWMVAKHWKPRREPVAWDILKGAKSW